VCVVGVYVLSAPDDVTWRCFGGLYALEFGLLHGPEIYFYLQINANCCKCLIAMYRNLVITVTNTANGFIYAGQVILILCIIRYDAHFCTC